MGEQSRLVDLEQDPPVTLAGGWRPSAEDRRYLDNQMLAMQNAILRALLLGIHASFYIVDTTSPAVAIGDVVCLAGSASNHRLVMRASVEAVDAAGGMCVGICMSAGQPGAAVLVALKGTLPPAVTGLAVPNEAEPFVLLNISGRCSTNNGFGATDVVIGMIDAAANLTLGPIARVIATGEGGGGGEGDIGGNVEGPAHDTRVVAISGDEDGEEVEVFANAFQWSTTVAAGAPEISISSDDSTGALQIKNEGKRALLAHATMPELGNDTAVNRVRGGVRFTTRGIGANITLDTTTKDTIAWINASVLRQVTLPPAGAGRTLFLPHVGPVAPLLKRAGSEFINGVASDYYMDGDAQGGLTIAIADGTNWVARTIKTGAGMLDGDVTGDGYDNVVVKITGDAGEGLVDVQATTLQFSSGGWADLKVADPPAEGALEIRHDGERVFLGHGGSPELGTNWGQTKLMGGLRLQFRNADGPVDDGGYTDTVCWMDATSEGTSVMLPTATQGRFLLLPFVGDNPPTLQRSGSELINGVASDYEMVGGASGGLGFAVCDGTNWVARTIKDSATVTLFGDVNGDADANLITTISGPGGGGGSVSVLAQELNFSGTATIEMPSESDGALELRHLGTRVVLVHAGGGSFSGPEFGANAGISMLRGGLRLATKNTAVDVTLDSASKESVVHVDASAAARNVTLPEAMGDGRIYIFVIKGSNTVTIKRFTGNTINSVAADYIVPLPNSCVIASCGSGGWFVRSFADSMGVTMGPGPGSATGSLSKTFGFSYAANGNANFDLTAPTYAGLKTAIDAGKVVMVKALTQCWYNWAPSSVTIVSTATSTVTPTQQGAPLFDGSESPEKVPPGSTFLNILGGPVAGILTVYLAE